MSATPQSSRVDPSNRQTLAILHPVFALTGLVHAIGGPLLPSLTSGFQLTDSRSGGLFFAYYAGTSLGALLCGRNYTRSLILGFFALAATSAAIAFTDRVYLLPLFFILGVSVGMPMSAVSMLAGDRFHGRSAAPLTFLNFSWSAGALIAPLFAARLLVEHTFRFAYVSIAFASVLAALACLTGIDHPPETRNIKAQKGHLTHVRLIAIFAFLTFLEVGIENTTGSWLATYVLRSSTAVGAAQAAASSSLYWFGFLLSRGVWSLILIRIKATRVLTTAVLSAIVASILLLAIGNVTGRSVAMIALGAALAPVFPLLLSRFFALARHSSDSRWVLAVCGFGGSVLPWITGSVSAHTGSLRLGLIVVPAALLLIAIGLPALSEKDPTEPLRLSNK